jgi:hypothetical protein
MSTRSRTEGKLEVGTSAQCFMHDVVKLWNGAPHRGKDAKTKFVAKKAIKSILGVYPCDNL